MLRGSSEIGTRPASDLTLDVAAVATLLLICLIWLIGTALQGARRRRVVLGRGPKR